MSKHLRDEEPGVPLAAQTTIAEGAELSANQEAYNVPQETAEPARQSEDQAGFSSTSARHYGPTPNILPSDAPTQIVGAGKFRHSLRKSKRITKYSIPHHRRSASAPPFHHKPRYFFTKELKRRTMRAGAIRSASLHGPSRFQQKELKRVTQRQSPVAQLGKVNTNIRSDGDGNLSTATMRATQVPMAIGILPSGNAGIDYTEETLRRPSLPTAEAVSEEDQQQILRDAEEHGRQLVLQQLVDAQVVAPQLFTEKNLKLPCFLPDSEMRFQKEHNALLLNVLRYLRPLAMGLYVVFYVWDVMQPGADIKACIIVRIGVCLIYYCLSLVADRKPKGELQPIMCMAYVLATTGISTILFIFKDGFVLGGAGIGLVIFVACTMGMLQFRYAVLFCATTLTISNTLAILSKKQSFTLAYVMVSLNMFVGTFCVLGTFSSYVVELHLRQRFRATGTIFRWEDCNMRSGDAIIDINVA